MTRCYDNSISNMKPHKETDPMGGFDPYSASKGASELIVITVISIILFLITEKITNRKISTIRAGNVLRWWRLGKGSTNS